MREVGLWNDLPWLHNDFQVGEVQICFGNDKFFGLSFLHIYSSNRSFRPKWIPCNIWDINNESRAISDSAFIDFCLLL